MRAVDTNVLVRFMAADDPHQTRLAERFIESCAEAEEQILIPVLVLCELVWVLERSYRNSKSAILRALDQILETELFVIESDSLVRRSIEDYRGGRANFADYLIGNIAKHAGCTDTVAFDRSLAGTAGFTILR